MASTDINHKNSVNRNHKRHRKKSKVIITVKSAVAIQKKAKKEPPAKKTKNKGKTKLSTKKAVTVNTKQRKREIEGVPSLTKEDIQRLTEILSRPFIREALVDIGGENAIAIIRSFSEPARDEEISKKLKIKISDVRAALNKLHSTGLVGYVRHKDEETGWYFYTWYLNKDRMEKWAEEQIKKLECKEEENNGEFYICPFCGSSTIVRFEEALEKKFKCDICNRELEYLGGEKIQKLGIIEQRAYPKGGR